MRWGRGVFTLVVTACAGYACGGGLPVDGADAGDAAEDPGVDQSIADGTIDVSLDTSEETQPVADATPDASDDGDATFDASGDSTVDALADVADEDATPDGSMFDASLDGALLDGGTLTLLASNQNIPIVVTVDATNVYWTNYTYSGGVMQCAKNGCNGTPLELGTLVNPFGITVDSTSVYVAAVGTANADGEVAKFAIGVANQTPKLLAWHQNAPVMIGTDAVTFKIVVPKSQVMTCKQRAADKSAAG